MPAGVVSVGVLADFAELIEQSDAAGVSIEAFSGKVVTSARTASRAMADFAKANGATADEAKAAAAQTAAAWDATYGKLSKGARDAGNAALTTSRMFKESADQQSASFAQAAGAQREYEAALQKGAAVAKETAAEQAAAAKAAADAAKTSAAETAAAAEASAARVTAAGKRLASVGKWTLFGGAAGVALSVDGATKLQSAMERLHTQAGVTQGAIAGLTKSVLNLAPSLATSPTALADSLYHVESGGIKGANSLKVMSLAAKEAKVSGADLNDTTTALTATVYSGIKGAGDYSKAMGILNATVGAGDMTFQDLNEALGGPMLATVKGYGLSLKDVGAAMATFGDDNIRGANAATQLRMAVQYMAKPAATAGPILQQLGLNTTSFANAMAKGGLLPALQLLHDKLVQAQVPAKDYAQVISDIFSKKGASGVDILENSLDKLQSKYKDLNTATGTNQAYAAWSKTLAGETDHLEATVEALADKLGTALVPELETVAKDTEKVIDWFGKHETAAKDLAKVIGGVLATAVTVYSYQKASAFVTATGDMLAAIGKLAGGVVTGAGKIVTATTGIGTNAGETATKVATATSDIEASNAETQASFESVATGAATAGDTLDTDWATTAASIETTNEAIQASNARTAASFSEVNDARASSGAGGVTSDVEHDVEGAAGGGALGVLARRLASPGVAGAAVGTALLVGGDDAPMKTYAKHPPDFPQSPAPKKGQSEESYIKATLGLPTGYKGGPITAASYKGEGSDVDYKAIDSTFKWLNEIGRFGRHGFVPKPGDAGTSLKGLPLDYAPGKSASSPGAFGQGPGGTVDYKTSMYPAADNAFIQSLAASTHLSPAVIAGWANAEERPGEVANAANPYNLLNISESGGTYRGTPTNIWKNPGTAAAATAKWIASGGGVPGWGPAQGAHGVPSILAAGGKTVAQQIAAIQNSGWVNGHANDPAGNYPDLAADVQAVAGTGTAVPIRGVVNAQAAQTSTIPVAVATMLSTAYALKGTAYSHEGNHVSADNPSGGYDTVAELKKIGVDCSGFVSAVLHSGGVNMPLPQTTQGLPSYLQKGKGRDVTVYDRTTGPQADDHTLIDILGRWFMSGGSTAVNPSSRVMQMTPAQAQQELHDGGASFQAFHPVYSSKLATDQQLETLGLHPKLLSPGGGGASILKTIQNLGGGSKLPQTIEAASASAIATELQDQTTKLQAVGQAQVTRLQAINQLLSNAGQAVVQNMANRQATRNDRAAGGVQVSANYQTLANDTSAGAVQLSANTQQRLTDVSAGRVQRSSNTQTEVNDSVTAAVQQLTNLQTQANDKAAAAVQKLQDTQAKTDDKAAATVTNLQNVQQRISDGAAAQVTALKDDQAIADEQSAMQVQAIKDQTSIIQDTSSQAVAAINDAATKVADSDNATATLITDNATTTADTLAERGLYGMNLVAQQLQVAADKNKASWDQQIATAQSQLDADQAAADVANATAQLNVDQVTAAQNQLVATAQQNVNLVTLKEDAAAAAAQQHVDQVTTAQDAKEAAAKLHLDTVTQQQDAKVAAAQQHVDQVTTRQDAKVAAAQEHLNIVTLRGDAKVAAAQVHVDAVTTRQDAKVAAAQEHLDTVTLKDDAKVSAAQVHLDQVTTRQDAKVSAAQMHADLVAVKEDQRILKATQHADAVQIQVDTSKIGPAQTAVDLSAGASKTVQAQMQANLTLATAQGSEQVNSAQAQLATVTKSANNAITGAQNSYQNVENLASKAIQVATSSYDNVQDAATAAIQTASNSYGAAQDTATKAIQGAQDQYSAAQNTADKLIQTASDGYSQAQDKANTVIQTAQDQAAAAQSLANAMIQASTDVYNTVQDAANQSIATAQQTQAQIAASWAQTLANDQSTLTGIQGQAGISEAAASGAVTTEQAAASTQFAGSGLTVQIYGVPTNDAAAITDEMSWAIRTSGVA